MHFDQYSGVLGMSRPLLIERQNYIPERPVEEFMVPLLRSKIVPMLESLPSLESGLALDVGCGRQPFRSFIEKRGYQYFSADAQNPLGIVDYVTEIDTDLPPALLERSPFDLVLCTEVLEHVADWDKAFSNFSLLLKAGGKLLITCPHFYILHEVPYDFWRTTVHGLLFYTNRWGLDCVSMEKAGGSWEILGTILGANLDTAKAIDRTIFNRALAFAIDKATWIAFRLMRTRLLQRRLKWGTERYELYLSNIALFEKHGSTPNDEQPALSPNPRIILE